MFTISSNAFHKQELSNLGRDILRLRLTIPLVSFFGFCWILSSSVMCTGNRLWCRQTVVEMASWTGNSTACSSSWMNFGEMVGAIPLMTTLKGLTFPFLRRLNSICFSFGNFWRFTYSMKAGTWQATPDLILQDVKPRYGSVCLT
jgi:hypothetical protein